MLKEIANDPDAIPKIMQMLDEERRTNKNLVTDLNFQLSRAHVVLEAPEMNKGEFVAAEIRKFYETGRIGHCYNMNIEVKEPGTDFPGSF
ncbi:MAG TPA: hypothetical protein VEA58_02810 [Anaerovoracaceae bacterium]|nr:hypothetical protein [Anaerovoracaceae bacterium]